MSHFWKQTPEIENSGEAPLIRPELEVTQVDWQWIQGRIKYRTVFLTIHNSLTDFSAAKHDNSYWFIWFYKRIMQMYGYTDQYVDN